VWVVTVMGAQDTTHAPSEIQLGASIKSIAVYGVDDATPAAAVWSSAFCNIILAAGDRIRAQILGCTLNDNLLLRYAGYKMKINLG